MPFQIVGQFRIYPERIPESGNPNLPYIGGKNQNKGQTNKGVRRRGTTKNYKEEEARQAGRKE